MVKYSDNMTMRVVSEYRHNMHWGIMRQDIEYTMVEYVNTIFTGTLETHYGNFSVMTR